MILIQPAKNFVQGDDGLDQLEEMERVVIIGSLRSQTERAMGPRPKRRRER